MMKLTVKRILSIMLAGCLLFAFGCSQSPAPSAQSGAASQQESQTPPQASDPFVGVWEVTGYIEDGKTLSGSELEEALGKNPYVLTLYEDGSMELTYESQTAVGTWEKKGGSEITLINDKGEKETVTISGDSLIADFDNNEQGVFTRTGDAQAKPVSSATGSDAGQSTQNASALAGTWTLSGGIGPDGDSYDRGEIVEALGASMEFLIQEDGSFTATMIDNDGARDEVNGTWSMDGEKFSMIGNGSEETGTFSGNQLAMDYDDGKLLFTKE